MNQENNMLVEFGKSDISYISELINAAESYLANSLPVHEIIQIMNNICSIYMLYENPDLLMFKAIWSEIDDIEDEIKDGKATQAELEEYIISQTDIMREACQKLIAEYTPILKELKEKFPIHYKRGDIFYIEELVNTVNQYLKGGKDSYTMISELDWLNSELEEYEDFNLSFFANLWSHIMEIKSKVKEDKATIVTSSETEEDIKKYIQSNTVMIKKICEKLIEEYTPILEELRRKYPNA